MLRRFPVRAAGLRGRSRRHTHLAHDCARAHGAVDGLDNFGGSNDLLRGIEQISLMHAEDHAFGFVEALNRIERSVEPFADFGREWIEFRQIGHRSAESVKFASHDCSPAFAVTARSKPTEI